MSIEEQLSSMRLYTQWTGSVTDTQTKTLNALPLVAIDGVKSHVVKIDLDNSRVIFELKMKPKVKVQESSIKYMESGVWALLGGLS